MDIDELLLGVVPVRPEHSSELGSCTHTCKHIPVTLEEGKAITAYPVRIVNQSNKTISAALCRECFVRLPRENQISEN
jgi:hypothetical protein